MKVFLTSKVTSALACLVFLVSGCQSNRDQDIREFTLIYTNDEHGYMEGVSENQGAATLLEVWREELGYKPDGSFLLLSGGDNWTGPAISSWTAGESMTEVMNAMHYDASAVGNHEFDFGLDEFVQRAEQADYPYLSANARWRDSDEVLADLGILPYTTVKVNGVRVGVIGLTTTSTPYTTNPEHVEQLKFEDYEKSLRETVPLVEQTEPDLMFVIAHVCLDELEPLAKVVEDLGIDLMGAGHCNELVAEQIGDTVILGGGFHFTSYASAHFRYDLVAKKLVNTEYETHTHRGQQLTPDPEIEEIISRWNSEFDSILGEVVAYSEHEISHRSQALEQAVVNSWLMANPDAQVAITNAGGLRSPLPAGEITLNDIVSLMPFDNTIVAVDISGEDLSRALEEGGRPVVGGLYREDGTWMVSGTGEKLDDNRTYRVLVNSFMYSGGDNFGAIPAADPSGFDTGVNYRQPFVDWLKSVESIDTLY